MNVKRSLSHGNNLECGWNATLQMIQLETNVVVRVSVTAWFVFL
jgi:hypothetical protein